MKIWRFLMRPANLPIFNAKFFFIVGSSTLFFYYYFFSDITGFLSISKQFLKVFVFNFSFFYLLWYGAGLFGEKALQILSNVCLILTLIFGCVEIFTLYNFQTLFNQVMDSYQHAYQQVKVSQRYIARLQHKARVAT